MKILWFTKADLCRWADREGQVWPCSQLKCLSDNQVMVAFDETGLVDLICPEWVQLNAPTELGVFIQDVISEDFN